MQTTRCRRRLENGAAAQNTGHPAHLHTEESARKIHLQRSALPKRRYTGWSSPQLPPPCEPEPGKYTQHFPLCFPFYSHGLASVLPADFPESAPHSSASITDFPSVQHEGSSPLFHAGCGRAPPPSSLPAGRSLHPPVPGARAVFSKTQKTPVRRHIPDTAY